YLYRACITRNKLTLDSAAYYLFEPISVDDKKEGVQVDGSYYQHGKQQAIASYGRVFVANSVSAAYYLRETKYALPSAKLDILVNYTKDTFLKTLRGSFYDFNVRGRGISRKDSLLGNVSDIIEKMKSIDPANLPYWEASILRTTLKKGADYKVQPSHAQFWKSNYTLHIRADYTFSVQSSSSRTLRTERGNDENILGKFLPDGATNLQRSGAEYVNIMPVWEWDKIPGTTSRDYLTDNGSAIQKSWGIPGTSEFVGGVSDGMFGVTTYDLNSDSVEAKKSWFFFDKEIYCLGAGINSKAFEHITTTVNQAWLEGKVETSSTNLKGARSWVLHDGIGYFFPNGENIKLSAQVQQGSWHKINHFYDQEEIKHSVFKIWIDHGNKPADQTYSYAILPKIDLNGIKKYRNNNAVHILANTNSIQAIKHDGLDMIQIVFHKAGSLVTGKFSIKVDQPCCVYIKDFSKGKAVLYVADPSQKLALVNVQLKLSKSKEETVIKCVLPKNAIAGATVSFAIN
ncbi:MAG: chondroitinase, partial [Chryseobacterium sp.]